MTAALYYPSGVEDHDAVGNIIKPAYQIDNGGLARAGSADEGDLKIFEMSKDMLLISIVVATSDNMNYSVVHEINDAVFIVYPSAP